MFWKRLRLVRLHGYPVELDASWVAVIALLVGTFAQRFAQRHPDLATARHWAMGGIAAALVFGSILIHELGHAVVARAFGVPVQRIALFVFGGVAQVPDPPPSPRAEILVALVGPVVSLTLGGAFLIGWLVGIATAWPLLLVTLCGQLAFVNLLLAGLNMLPAYPLDAGRMLRALLWALKDLQWATRVTAAIGSAFGVGLVLLGVAAFITGNFVGGLWNGLLGLYLTAAARMSYPPRILRRALEGTPLRPFVTTAVIGVPPELPLDAFAEQFAHQHPHAMFPVIDGEQVLGRATTRALHALPRTDWEGRTVADILEPASADNTIAPDADAIAALAQMNRHGLASLLVVDGGSLVGVVTLADLLRFLAPRLELERT